jgi:hypothetical protein
VDADYNLRHHVDGPAAGLGIVARILALPERPPKEGLLFDLTHCDEPGAMNRFQITLPLTSAAVATVVSTLDVRTPEAFVADRFLGLTFTALVGIDDDSSDMPVREATARFINENRGDFQPECHSSDPHWFGIDPGVNDWTVLWVHGGLLSYLHWDSD